MAIKNDTANLFKILQQIDQRNFARVYILDGEKFQRDETLKSLIHVLTDEGTRAFNLDIIDGEEVDFNEVMQRAGTFPMMGNYRVVAVHRAESLQLKTNDLTRLISNIPSSTILILTGDKFDTRSLKGVTSSVDVRHHNFGRVFENHLGKWITAYLSRMGLHIEEEALEFLIDSEGEDLGTITSEIDKITTILGDRKSITLDDTRKVIGQFRTYRGSDLADAITSGNTARALEILHFLLESRQGATAILFDMVNYFTALGIYIEYKNKRLNDTELIRMTGRKPYWHKVRFDRKLTNWNADRVSEALFILGETESQLKKSHLSDQHIFETLMLRLADPMLSLSSTT